VAAHDVGRAVNPALCEGQIEGSVHMGLGYALTEELPCVDGMAGDLQAARAGRAARARHARGRGDPRRGPEPEGPFGAKGVGEIGLVPTAGAVAGALAAFDGVRRYTLPMKDSPAARAMSVGKLKSKPAGPRRAAPAASDEP
jgi:CO/xanthine dehydrogenase Mo-binding subunit